MPELPEMETYRRHLERNCLGQRILKAEIGRERSLNVVGAEFAEEVEGTAFTGFSRAGKMLVLHLSTGRYLLNHLMLGGGIFCGGPGEEPERTFQVVLELGDGRALRWFGLRLGWLHLLDEAELTGRLAEIGLDPLSPAFGFDYLAGVLRGRRGALKPCLVDQRFLAGIGNCYADEICWAAQIHPLRAAGGLHVLEQERLAQAIRETLTQAVRMGGYTETPFSPDDRLTGGYLPFLQVYDRQAEPCSRCGTPISLEHAGGRKVFHCPVCQPREPQFPAGAISRQGAEIWLPL